MSCPFRSVGSALVLSMVMLLAPPVVLGQQENMASKPDGWPAFFKVYGRGGRESLSATCTPDSTQSVVAQVSCEITHVRFEPPQVDKTIPLSVGDVLKADPRLEQEVKKDPRKFEQEFNRGLEKARQDVCSSSGRAAIEAQMRASEVGPKRRSHLQQVIAACSDRDPAMVFRRFVDLQRRTCGLWVDRFRLDFRKVREDQWLYQQETPGLLSNVLKIYELTRDGPGWTLSETRVPTRGARQEPARVTWSFRNSREYELPCEFISHGLVQY